MIWLSLILFSLLGGWLSRMCGGAPPKLPFGLDQWLYGLPYLLIGVPAMLMVTAWSKSASKWNKWYPATLLAAYLSAVIGKRTGHGGGMDLGHSPEEPGKGREAEKIEYLILWLDGQLSKYWYDALLLALTGLLVTVPAGILVAFISPFWGAFLAVSGITKPIAYMIGWAIYPNFTGKGLKWLNEATAIGEFLTGFFAYLSLGITAIAIWL